MNRAGSQKTRFCGLKTPGQFERISFALRQSRAGPRWFRSDYDVVVVRLETPRSSGLTEFVAREILQECPQGLGPMPPAEVGAQLSVSRGLRSPGTSRVRRIKTRLAVVGSCESGNVSRTGLRNPSPGYNRSNDDGASG